MVADWIRLFISLFQSLVDWFAAMKIEGVSLSWIIIAGFFFVVMVRSMLVKP